MLCIQAMWGWLYINWVIHSLNMPITQVMVGAVIKGAPVIEAPHITFTDAESKQQFEKSYQLSHLSFPGQVLLKPRSLEQLTRKWGRDRGRIKGPVLAEWKSMCC